MKINLNSSEIMRVQAVAAEIVKTLTVLGDAGIHARETYGNVIVDIRRKLPQAGAKK